jgi:hypothetical protein
MTSAQRVAADWSRLGALIEAAAGMRGPPLPLHPEPSVSATEWAREFERTGHAGSFELGDITAESMQVAEVDACKLTLQPGARAAADLDTVAAALARQGLQLQGWDAAARTLTVLHSETTSVRRFMKVVQFLGNDEAVFTHVWATSGPWGPVRYNLTAQDVVPGACSVAVAAALVRREGSEEASAGGGAAALPRPRHVDMVATCIAFKPLSREPPASVPRASTPSTH